MFRLSRDPRDLSFPPVERATPDGLVAIGGDLRPERLLEAYRRGIFPWYNEGQPILWWSPDPRAVIFPQKLHVSRSLERTMRRGRFRVTLDTRFGDVVARCAGPRPQYPDGGTWITPEMATAYKKLYDLGFAHSVETWEGEDLVGGVYGVAIGGAFFGESMFSSKADASKVALVSLIRQLQAWGFRLFDCQQASPHVVRLGAEEIPRRDFLTHLSNAIRLPGRKGRWEFDRID
jgi:leucyl/phenylalanyl-tRNA--protein transferase